MTSPGQAEQAIIRLVTRHFSQVQAIYLFGSYGTEFERRDSDADIALLLPHQTAKDAGYLSLGPLSSQLARHLHKAVDIINLRQVSTVLQKEIIMAERRIYCTDEYAAAEFEMLTISFYQQLNEERQAIIGEVLQSGRFYNL